MSGLDMLLLMLGVPGLGECPLTALPGLDAALGLEPACVRGTTVFRVYSAASARFLSCSALKCTCSSFSISADFEVLNSAFRKSTFLKCWAIWSRVLVACWVALTPLEGMATTAQTRSSYDFCSRC